jgi:hypothetical protein
MTMRLLLAVGLVAAAVATAVADEISIPLPGLTGNYQAFREYPPGSGDVGRWITLAMPVEITRIDQLRLAISGTWHIGEQHCTDNPHGGSTYSMPAALVVSLSITGTSGYFGAAVWPSGDFSGLTDVFDPCCPPEVLTSDQLLGQVVNIHIYVVPRLFSTCGVISDTYGTISDVQLQITGDVPTTASAWGEIKALYHQTLR